MARLLAESADLLEIDGGDGFRMRSYRRVWLGPEDVLNTLGAEDFMAALRPRP
ncbi:MAG TPA: PHP domain-containing protein [Terracidiphilus sp.]|jgi:hypothetical protein|nr:PHP domain-containing protein [Terracidiphilus sp.]